MDRSLEMFEKTRKKRERLMHVCDAGNDSEVAVKFSCPKCKHKTDWLIMPTVTAAKRGIPCPWCN